jgi:hypothetical protein
MDFAKQLGEDLHIDILPICSSFHPGDLVLEFTTFAYLVCD